MTADKIFVSLGGLFTMGFIAWFFLFKNEEEIRAENSIDITVDGGYSPEAVFVPRGKTTKLNFFRKDSTDCLDEVVLGDFKIRRKLPLNQKVTVEITPQKTGEYDYSCAMNMYHGKIIVRD